MGKSTMWRDVLGVLMRAREIILSGWCQGSMAQNANGSPLNLEDTDATHFCAIGALDKALTEAGKARATVLWTSVEATCAKDLLDEIAMSRCSRSIVSFNDTSGTTQRDVLVVYDIAIEKAKEKAMVELSSP